MINEAFLRAVARSLINRGNDESLAREMLVEKYPEFEGMIMSMDIFHEGVAIPSESDLKDLFRIEELDEEEELDVSCLKDDIEEDDEVKPEVKREVKPEVKPEISKKGRKLMNPNSKMGKARFFFLNDVTIDVDSFAKALIEQLSFEKYDAKLSAKIIIKEFADGKFS